MPSPTKDAPKPYDVVIVGGGPGGLAAALALGRANKRVLLCDRGPRRNAAAIHLHNFVSRDGVTPDAFRTASREQLAAYPLVDVHDTRVEAIDGGRGAFRLTLDDGSIVVARRIILATGMIDLPLTMDGFADHWGSSIFQCPYCHGYDHKGRRWATLARVDTVAHIVPFALQLRGWTDDVAVVVEVDGLLGDDARQALGAGGIHVAGAPVRRLVGSGGALQAIELADGQRLPCDVLFAHPPQRQVDVVASLKPRLDEHGFVVVDQRGETSIPGVFAAGDLCTRMHAAIAAASAGTFAAVAINIELTIETATAR